MNKYKRFRKYINQRNFWLKRLINPQMFQNKMHFCAAHQKHFFFFFLLKIQTFNLDLKLFKVL